MTLTRRWFLCLLLCLTPLWTQAGGNDGLVAVPALTARVTDLAGTLPNVIGDPIAFRRILENLVANAVDSLESKPGRVTISTASVRCCAS